MCNQFFSADVKNIANEVSSGERHVTMPSTISTAVVVHVYNINLILSFFYNKPRADKVGTYYCTLDTRGWSN